MGTVRSPATVTPSVSSCRRPRRIRRATRRKLDGPCPAAATACSSSAAGSVACRRPRPSVVTIAASPGHIAQPPRSILRRQRNTTVLLGEAVGLDVERREVLLADGGPLPYDTLIVAAGARFSYFGHDEWSGDAPG